MQPFFRIQRVAECASTSDEVKKWVKKEGVQANGRLLVTQHQTGGRGRRQPDWWSGSPHENLAFSCAIAPPPRPAESLGLLAAVSMADVLAPLVSAEVALKWPNDILLNGKKVGGLLAEIPATDGPPIAILGIGVNVGQAPPQEIAPYPTTCVAHHTKYLPKPEAILNTWMATFREKLLHYQAMGPHNFEAEFLRYLRQGAPFGVHESRSGITGDLLEFSIREGLTWGSKHNSTTQPLGWIATLHKLKKPAP